jgi:hypothetical protein
MAAQAPVFAREPGNQDNNFLDYNNRRDLAIYKASIESLYDNTADYFDLTRDHLNLFLDLLQDRATTFGWTENVLLIDDDVQQLGQNGPGTYFIDAHGAFSLEHIQQVERHYNAEETRTSQNSVMLARCILNSLTQHALTRVHARRNDWTLSVQVQGAEVDMVCGVCLLKVILIITQQETRSTVAYLMAKLSVTGLQPIMEEVEYNIESFNDQVDTTVRALQRNQRVVPGDLLMNLLTVYATVPDENFQRFIQVKSDKYLDEGIDLDYPELMTSAKEKYHDLLNVKQTWRAPTAHEKELAALKAEVTSLKSKVKKSGKTESKKTSGKGGKTPDAPKVPRPDWMVKRIKPKDLKTTRTWNGKSYHWCCPETGGKCDGKWVTHKTSECKGSEYVFKAKRNPDAKPSNAAEQPKKKVRFANTVKAQQKTQAAPAQLQAALADAQAQDSDDSEQ